MLQNTSAHATQTHTDTHLTLGAAAMTVELQQSSSERDIYVLRFTGCVFFPLTSKVMTSFGVAVYNIRRFTERAKEVFGVLCWGLCGEDEREKSGSESV